MRMSFKLVEWKIDIIISINSKFKQLFFWQLKFKKKYDLFTIINKTNGNLYTHLHLEIKEKITDRNLMLTLGILHYIKILAKSILTKEIK